MKCNCLALGKHSATKYILVAQNWLTEHTGFYQCLLTEYLNPVIDYSCSCFSPITQISSGITNLNLLVKESRPGFPGQSSKPISWSSIAKKEPLQTIKPQNNIPKPLPKSYKPKQEKTISTKVNESAVSAGYRFKAKNPEADPRYPAAHQLMVGPIPGKLSLVAQSSLNPSLGCLSLDQGHTS